MEAAGRFELREDLALSGASEQFSVYVYDRFAGQIPRHGPENCTPPRINLDCGERSFIAQGAENPSLPYLLSQGDDEWATASL